MPACGPAFATHFRQFWFGLFADGSAPIEYADRWRWELLRTVSGCKGRWSHKTKDTPSVDHRSSGYGCIGSRSSRVWSVAARWTWSEQPSTNRRLPCNILTCLTTTITTTNYYYTVASWRVGDQFAIAQRQLSRHVSTSTTTTTAYNRRIEIFICSVIVENSVLCFDAIYATNTTVCTFATNFEHKFRPITPLGTWQWSSKLT